MSALTTSDQTTNANATDNPPASLLPKQLLEFANEAFAFSDSARARAGSETGHTTRRFAAPPRHYFADVTPPPLSCHQLKNTRVLAAREQLLPLLPKGGICAEVGTHSGHFGWQILSVLEPHRLHLFDRDFHSFDDAPFGPAIENGTVELHEGGVAEHLAAYEDGYFDFICLHPGHSYTAATRVLEQAGRKIKEQGSILCANYMTYSPLEGVKYGVVRAVNEFCHTNFFELTHLALNSLGCHDAVLKKCPQPEPSGSPGGGALDAPDPNTFLPDIWQHLIEKYQPRSVLDVGAGAGWSTKWFSDRGIYTLGVEGCPEALARSQCRTNMVAHDYSQGPFVPSMVLDLAWSAGFVDQLEEKFIPNLMASLRACQNVCLLHGEPGQPASYWIQKMNEFGFDLDSEETTHLQSLDKHKASRHRGTLSFFRRRNQ